MKSFVLLTIGLLFSTCDCAADMMPPPFALSVLSPDGSKIVRVERETWESAGKRRSPVKMSVYTFDAKLDQYSLITRFDLGDDWASEFLYVTNDAKYLIAVNIGHWVGSDALGIRMYDTQGKLLRRWRLKEFLTEEEIGSILRTGSSTQWFEPGYLINDKLLFSSPALSIHGLGGSFTVMKGGEAKPRRYHFELDLKSLELKRQ